MSATHRYLTLLASALFWLPAGCSTLPLVGDSHGSQSIRHASGTAYCLTSPCVYVTNAYGPPSVDIYRARQRGAARPAERIKGANTELSGPEAVAVDSAYNVYVADINGYYQSAILVYPAGEYRNDTPAQTITGPDTEMGIATGVAVDSSAHVYVSNFIAPKNNKCTGSVTVYAPGADGDVSPIAQIKGRKTLLCGPHGIALDSKGNIYVTTGLQYNSAVNIYAAGSTGNIAPVARIHGKRTMLDDPGSIALDSAGNVYVAPVEGQFLTTYRAGEHGDTKPAKMIVGMDTKLKSIVGVSVDSSGDIYACNENPQGNVVVFGSGANGDAPPIRVIKARGNSLKSPSNIAIR